MIVKVQPSRKHSSSFKRLHEYLTQEHDADTGEVRLRGDVVMSENLLSFDTAAGEMLGVASLNDRCRMRYATMNWHGRQENVRLDHNGQTQQFTH